MVCILGHSLGHCREPLGSPTPGQHPCADPGLLPAWWEPRGCVGLLAPACTCSVCPSFGSAVLTLNRSLGLQPLASLFLFPRGAQMC